MANSDPVALPIALRSSTPIQFTHQIHTSLTHENFLLWKSQVLPVLRGHGLAGFLDGSRPSPSQFLVSSNGAQSLNPDFESWHQQDQLILAWLFSSISPSVPSQVVRCDTSASLWSTLNQIHSSQSMAKILDLKLQLQTLKKGGDTCSEFLHKIQFLADRLRSIGTDIPDHDLVLYALQGLGSEFESFITAISMRSVFPSMLELTTLLLAHEARCLSQLRSSSSTTVHLTNASADPALSLSNSAVYYSNAAPRSTDQSHPASNFTPRGRSRGRFPRGRDRGRPNRSPSSYQTNSYQTNSYQPNSYQTNSSSDSPMFCQICNKRGHGALDCYHRFDIRYTTPSNSPQALIAEPFNLDHSSSNQPAPWYLDSGASTHVTADLQNLQSSQPYHGTDMVHIGNGTCLFIAHTGTALFPTSFKPLLLTNVLHVPAITKNLLSISQLVLDNNVTVEFSPNSCFVKDPSTHMILLHGSLHKGLYKITPSSSSSPYQAYSAQLSTLDDWHSRLAHCSHSVLDQLRKAHAISIKPSSSFSFCSSCNKAKAHKLPFLPSISSVTKPLEVSN